MASRTPDKKRAAQHDTSRPLRGGEHRISSSSVAYNAADLPADQTTEAGPAYRAGPDGRGEVVALFPGGGARRAPAPDQLDAVLAAFWAADRLSLRRLKLLSDLPHDLVVLCVERLAADGLLTVERRPDGNESRGIASLTDEGRRSLGGPGTAG